MEIFLFILEELSALVILYILLYIVGYSSILVHELGHAIVAKRLGGTPLQVRIGKGKFIRFHVEGVEIELHWWLGGKAYTLFPGPEIGTVGDYHERNPKESNLKITFKSCNDYYYTALAGPAANYLMYMISIVLGLSLLNPLFLFNFLGFLNILPFPKGSDGHTMLQCRRNKNNDQ